MNAKDEKEGRKKERRKEGRREGKERREEERNEEKKLLSKMTEETSCKLTMYWEVKEAESAAQFFLTNSLTILHM